MAARNSPFSLEGRLAAVTGGLGLIGRATCAALADAGADVLALDVDDEAGARFAGARPGVRYARFDAAESDGFAERLAQMEEAHGPVRVWVNAAYPRTPDWRGTLEETKAGSWRQNVDWQLNATCLLCNAVGTRMAERGEGAIVNVGSIYGLVGPEFGVYAGTDMTMPAAYAAIKGGLVNYTRYLASYWGPRGVRVNVVCPGGVFDGQPEAFVANYAARTPLRRMATPEEIAAPIVFLASAAAAYVTGAVIPVDGGWTAV